MAEISLDPHDVVVVLSFGGPEAPDEVMPFLRRVVAGRGVPDERLHAVAEHYYHFGGRSPINDQNRALVAALEAQLAQRGLSQRVVLANRNSEPFLADVLTDLAAEGVRAPLVVTTSAYSCYSSCRQYRENLAAAVTEVEERLDHASLAIAKVRPYAGHPAYVEAVTDRVVETLSGCTDAASARTLWVTHSVPEAMDETSGPGDGEGHLYVDQHLRVGAAVAAAVEARTGTPLTHELVFCSRSGPPQQPWLEPDVNDRLRELAAEGVREVILAPIGFISDHMEVVNDLDREAAQTASEVGIEVRRVPTVGTHAVFVDGLVDLLLERAAQTRGEDPVLADAIGGDVRPSTCAPGCCPNLRVALPALCGQD